MKQQLVVNIIKYFIKKPSHIFNREMSSLITLILPICNNLQFKF